MLMSIVMLAGGTAVLTLGAEAAVRGAGRFAAARAISPFVLGALLFGVDVESLGAALIAAARGQTSLAAAEAFGTIVFLFSAGFGAALLISRQPIPSPSVSMVLWPGLSMAAGALAIADQTVSSFEGALLVAVYVFYVIQVIQQGNAEARGREIEREAAEGPRLSPIVLVVAGLLLVYGGASLLVEGGVRILARTSLSAGFVGAAIIGALAAADEVLLEVLPVKRGLTELATGNLFGTVAAFSSGVLGLAALIRPLTLDSATGLAYLAATLLYTIVAIAFVARGRAGKLVGAIVLAVYLVWLVVSVRI